MDESVRKISDINKALVMNNINVSCINKEGKDLEEYFINLMGVSRLLNLLYGERYKMKKDNLSIIILFIYIITGVLFFIQFKSVILDCDITELANDDTLGLFSLMLGDLSRYGNELYINFIRSNSGIWFCVSIIYYSNFNINLSFG